jgi:phage-related protein
MESLFEVVFYKEDDGSIPVLDWLDTLPVKVRHKCMVRFQSLEKMGHRLRRPIADYLRDGLYELRIRAGRVNYRILYFFHNRRAVVLVHGLTKEKSIHPSDIQRAKRRKEKVVQNPNNHLARIEI